MKMRETTENLKDEENIMNSYSGYACVNDFLVDERTCAMIKTLGIDSYSVKKIIENYVGHLQVPIEWKPSKPLKEKKRARESTPMVEFSYEPIQENIKKKCRKEEHIRRRLKKPEKNPEATNANIVIFKDLMEARIMDNEVVMLDFETSEFIIGKV